ncbi:MAG TPA: two-component regulator propeller domain-containing protein, partial [Verrucomicrobiae bacterium]|nr:two-component regulator propeller domain-containing protein [Verrucomicrobiae bacterium]
MTAPRFFSRTWLAAWLCLSVVMAARGLDSRKYLLEYIPGESDSTSGLPNDSVRAIAQDKAGWLWIGTDAGLARFDGFNFKIFNSSNTPPIQVNRIDTLYGARDGSLWIGAYGMLVQHRDGVFTRVDLPPPLSHHFMTTFCEDAAGRLWVGAYTNVFILDKERRIQPVPDWPPAMEPVRSICKDVDGSMWIGTPGNGVANLRQGGVVWYPPGENGFGTNVCGVLSDPSGGVHVAERSGDFYRIKDGRVTLAGSTRPLFSGSIETIVLDRSGVLWVGTTGRLFRFKDGEQIPPRENIVYPNDTVNALFEDREGSIWVGGQRTGLHSLKDSNVALLDLHFLPGAAYVRCLMQARDGSLWFGSDNGVGRFQNGRVTRVPGLEQLAEKQVMTLAQSANGIVWIGTGGGGLSTFDGKDMNPFILAKGSSSFDIRSILEARDGSMWIGTRSNGLYQIRTGAGFARTNYYDIGTNEVRYLHEDRSGTLWLACHAGGLRKLVKRSPEELGKIEDPLQWNPDFAEFQGRSIHEDSEGTLWFGGHKSGLLRLRGTNWAYYPLASGFPDRTVHEILEDRQGNLWLSSDQTIVSVKKEDLEKYARKQLDRIPFVDLTQVSAVRFGGCNGGSQAPGCQGLGGRLWFASRKGPVMVDADHWRSDFPTPIALIEEAVMDRKTNSATKSMVFPPGNGGALFRYTAFGSVDPAKIRFQHQLEGVDSGWTDSDTSRSVPYPRIPPGDYRFRVRAAGQPGEWGDEAVFAFRLLPHFWQRWQFKTACGVAAVAAVAYIIWLRWRILRREMQLRQETAVEQERSRIARDIHDDLGAR